ncbi:MAG: aminotransferase class I/II-fold pyridoxal phosphate-dependent enzyme [Solobacterium sp.]|nr:aminotransferase class I/II-fold pyridoxal phosphate-dependent enzyme [Solobacterium sp.]
MVPFEKKVWLATPMMHGEEEAFIHDAFVKNWVTTIGENIDELEKNFIQYLGCRYAVGLSSGTSAIHLAVKLAGIGPGDYVLCSDMTFSATVNPVAYEKGIAVFVDSEYETWNMDPEALKKGFELYPQAKAVIVANLYGTPAKLDEIKAICDEHGAVLIEDAAESLGAVYKGKMTGSFGKYNIISFNGNKIITCSTGGMLLTDDEEAAKKARKWSTQSRDAAPWYQHTELGYNYRMSNIIAGVGRGQFLHLQEHLDMKRAIYDRYKEGLKDLPVQVSPYIEGEMVPNFWLSCMIIDEDAMCEQTRDDHTPHYVHEYGKSCPTEILETLAKYNAEGRPIWKPMHMQPIYKDNPHVQVRENSVGEDVFRRGLCLPTDINMTPEEQEIIIQIIHMCFDK